MAFMKHKGKAQKAGLRLIVWTLVALGVVTGLGVLAVLVGTFVAALAGFLFGGWALFALLAFQIFEFFL